jgi:tetratricopeptide (TPR) repeat protein
VSVRAAAGLAAVAWLAGCDKKAAETAAAPPVTTAAAPAAAADPALSGSASDAMRLLQSGQTDEALALLDASTGDADQLAVLGAAWAKKAETAPLPTPLPQMPAPEFKPEELTALGFLDRALQVRPDHPVASLVLARVLTPHAVRRFDLEKAAKQRKGRSKGVPPPAAGGPDFAPERILTALRTAVTGMPVSREPIEQMFEFAVRVERYDDAQWALDETLKRDKENAEPLVRYGDFLRDRRNEPHQAIERYREALMWKPDDEAVLNRIADIYIGQGIEAFDRQQWAVSQSRLQEAQKYVRNANSPQGLRIRDYQSRLATIRTPR